MRERLKESKVVLGVVLALAALLAGLALGFVDTQDAGARGATSSEKLGE